MDFRIRGLMYESFGPLFAVSEPDLRRHGTVRRVAPPGSAYPCRVSLHNAAPGETVILTSFVHLDDAASPYRALGPIFVRRDPGATFDRVNEIPPALRGRPLSLRAYDAQNLIVAAEVADSETLQDAVRRLFGGDDIAAIHVHHAAFGCYLCRVERA